MKAIYKEKADFVEKYLKPLLVATGERTGISDVKYVYDADNEQETVFVTVYGEEYGVNVNWDSEIAIVNDVMRGLYKKVI